mmetsp:Transcript_143693/g.250788  ORF Transcript_143693/g.250788 Transcript_143693/m.250788 type:complete len:220 (-) Transcript_143693:322-981(-)
MFARFLGKKPDAGPSPNTQIQKLGDTLETIEKREAVLSKKIDAEVAKAREASKKGNKNLALTHLKRKKQYEEQMTKLSAQRMNIENMQMKMEEATMNLETLKAQKEGAKAIKEMYGKMTPDKIDADMETVREVMDHANEISDALSQPLGDQLDEDDLEAELAELEQADLDQELLGIDNNALPAIPSGTIGEPSQAPAQKAQAKDDEEEALSQLEAELNM